VATSSISGLASGLDTAAIINQLMQLEATSQTRLKARQSAQKTALAALQSLNTDVSSLAGKAEMLAKTSTWQTMKATSSNAEISATVGSTAAASTFSVTVDQVAIAHQFALKDTHALSDVVVAGGGSPTSVRLTGHDGTVHNLATGGGTLQELAAAINGSTKVTGVSATAVRVADGSYRLMVASTKTGAASDFTLTNADGSALMGGVDTATLRQGADARVTIGGIAATSSTNTFTDVVPGVTLTLKGGAAAGQTSTITVGQDASGVKASVKALVDQLNGLLTKLDAQTAPGAGSATAGVLAGDATARSLRSTLVSTVFGSGGTTSMAGVGIQTDRYGKLVFDEAAFDKAYAADPAAVAAQFTSGASTATDGWAARLQTVAKAASDPRAGSLTAAITGRQTGIDRLGDDIEAWDQRLELRRTTLTRQYTSLETALSKMQSQGNWLAGQLGSLPSYSS
jgi:flagellar hook-associated protein 2